MATAPTCKLCGKAHWAHEGHAWAKADPERERTPAVRPSPPAGPRIAELEAQIAALKAENDMLRSEAKARRDHRRDYMRKYRSKER